MMIPTLTQAIALQNQQKVTMKFLSDEMILEGKTRKYIAH